MVSTAQHSQIYCPAIIKQHYTRLRMLTRLHAKTEDYPNIFSYLSNCEFKKLKKKKVVENKKRVRGFTYVQGVSVVLCSWQFLSRSFFETSKQKEYCFASLFQLFLLTKPFSFQFDTLSLSLDLNE